MKKTNKISRGIRVLLKPKLSEDMMIPITLLIIISVSNIVTANELKNAPLGFYQAIKSAQNNDPWLMGNKHKQLATEAKSIYASTLADPKIAIGFANIASDSFEFNQEPMSQFKIGITQMFPRGDSRNIKKRQLKIESEAFPFQRQDRQAKVAVTVGTLWLDLFRVQQSMALIEKNRSLFEHLVDITQASYSSSQGGTRQQDIVRAQLEVSRIEDKLVQLQQMQALYRGQLTAWLTTNEINNRSEFQIHTLENTLPDISLQQEKTSNANDFQQIDSLAFLSDIIAQHPAVIAVDKKIKSTAVNVELAQQKYQPEWGVTASYSLRNNDPLGNDRADLFSLGVVFELPLFTANRQDQEVNATISQTEAIKTDKQLLLRKLYSSYVSNLGRLQQVLKRKALFDKKLMPQFRQQAEITLNAYTHDSGDFSEVVRAKIDELNAEIDYLAINVEQQKLQVALNYLFIKADLKLSGFQLNTRKEGLYDEF
jgi:outer membrane protein TolC